MNVFVLNTGRCGSTTFVVACRHISNYTSGHETRCALLGAERFDYPNPHIEADNRLSWLLGRLQRHYGDNAFYVHLKRSDEETAKSFVKRYGYDVGIINAYRRSILLHLPTDAPATQVALDYCDTVNSNIELFFRDKTPEDGFSPRSCGARFPRVLGADRCVR